ncbi:MAG: TetR family transcriptional regulator [Rhodovulum sulfidophilum]|uniref:TetR family transcriptional regulator n=1 Tax=Rhodovulum sulfidophilum TaxID=35806 RepID=A0A2W5NC47_RHOSU|nr:MAG: TetR family transcriptional regulator [Rhodovulum sulfidophilum]
MADRPTYHHGDLRNALLAAALELLEAEGRERLSLRRVAARVGVSHAAPAHHFPTLRALLTALATIGFERFDAAMRRARQAATPDPAAQLRAAEAGYLAYARANPALFRLMFDATLLDWTDPALVRASEPGYAQLVEICAPAAARLGITDRAGRAALERLVWSVAHGRAHLSIDGKIPPGLDGPPAIDLTTLLIGPAEAGTPD